MVDASNRSVLYSQLPCRPLSVSSMDQGQIELREVVARCRTASPISPRSSSDADGVF